MIKILEMLIVQYFIFRNYILGGMGIFCVCIIIGGLCYCKENRRYIVDKLLQKIMLTIIFIAIGSLLYLLGVTTAIEYVYFNSVIFIFAMGIIIISGIVQMIMFKKIIMPMVQICKYAQYVLFLELFLLAATYRLETIEWIVAMFAILCCQLMTIVIGTLKTEEKEISKESDYPNPHVYYTREQ